MIRIIVHAANSVMRAGLVSIINAQSNMEVVGSSADEATLIGLLQQQPDVLLLEWSEENAWWEQLLVRETEIGIRAVVFLADVVAREEIIEFASEGAIAFLPLSATAEEIIAAVKAVAIGLLVIHPELADSLFSINYSSMSTLSQVFENTLTPREIEVLQLLAFGLDNKAIAQGLNISKHTVKFHISSILTKLNVSSRTEAVTAGLRQGLILL